MRYAFVLGKNPDLSIAELGCFLKNTEVSRKAGVVFYKGELPANPQQFLNRLGGILEILEIFECGLPMGKIEASILKYLINICKKNSGKCNFGINLVLQHKKSTFLKFLLPKMKQNLRAHRIKANFMNRDFKNVSSIFALKHNLTKSHTNISIIDEGGGKFSLGYCVALQDVESYSKRDYGKPFRDPGAGMLPPKLAQIMVNLGSAPIILDPFCGTGTILMETLLIGYSSIGSDKDHRMVEGTKKNIEWLRKTFKIPQNVESKITNADAIENLPITDYRLPITIITEPYLGPPLSQFPHENFLTKLMVELSTLYINFFKNLATWIPKGTVIVIIFPYWRKSNTNSVRLSEKINATIENLGFSKTTFHPLSTTSLFYERPDQVVGREIVRFIYEEN